MKKSIGYQILIDLYDCDYGKMEDLEYIKKTMKELSNVLGTSIRDEAFHKFSPFGISGVLIIAESHLTIHTWPEYRYAGIDLFTCAKKLNTDKAIEFLCQSLNVKNYEVKEINRGNMQYRI